MSGPAVDLSSLVARFSELIARTGPAAPILLFLASFIEYVFPPFPGDALVALGAWYAARGFLSWPLAFFCVTAGALCGTAVDWQIGRWLGGRLDAGVTRGKLDPAQLERFQVAYRKWGALLLVANRFVPGVRAFFSVAAGAAGVPLWKVLVYGGISACLWNVLLLAAGAYVAKNADELVGLVARYNTVAAAVVVVGLSAALAVWWWRRRAARSRPGSG